MHFRPFSGSFIPFFCISKPHFNPFKPCLRPHKHKERVWQNFATPSLQYSLLKFSKWFKYGLKAQKLQKQHALKAQKVQKQHALKAQKVQKQHALKAQKLQKQHALKGQKLLAQGIALGIMAISKAPCKGKSFMFCLEF